MKAYNQLTSLFFDKMALLYALIITYLKDIIKKTKKEGAFCENSVNYNVSRYGKAINECGPKIYEIS